MKNFISLIWAAFALPFLIISCKKDADENTVVNSLADQIPSHYHKVGETYLIGASAKAVLYTDASKMEAAYTNLYVALYDSISNTRLSDGHLSINPTMEMGTMIHSAPFNNPIDSKPIDKIWKSTAVFMMSGTWQLGLSFHNHHNDLEGEGSINIVVSDPLTPKVKFLTTTNNEKLLVALIQPTTPKIGINNFSMAIYRKQSMMSFPPDTSYLTFIHPEMPDMGHGSPNNINPTHKQNGEYYGKVNFTMSGYWRVNIALQRSGFISADSLYFDIIF